MRKKGGTVDFLKSMLEMKKVNFILIFTSKNKRQIFKTKMRETNKPREEGTKPVKCRFCLLRVAPTFQVGKVGIPLKKNNNFHFA